MKGSFFNIQKCSIHDGPGIRTTIFLKGCLLKCKWCANPESQNFKPEIMLFPKKCIGCGACKGICSVGAIRTEASELYTDREACIQCGKCAEICYAGARSMVGEEISAEELFKEVQKDIAFYGNSQGGVTVSGGEPLLQPEFLHEFFGICRRHNISTAMETCAYARYENFHILKTDLDLIYIDIKHMNRERHKALTGVDNLLILENIRKINSWNIPIIIRTPVIPGLNDTLENIKEIAIFCEDMKNVKQYELLAYHRLGINKYRSLGRPYELEEISEPDKERMRILVDAANRVFQGSQKICFFKN